MTGAAKIRLGLGAGLAIFFAIVVAVGVRNYAWVQEDRYIQHTHEVIDELNQLALHSKETENSFRRYVISPNPRDIENGRTSLNLTSSGVNEIARLTTDNPSQQRNVGLAGGLIARQAQLLARAAENPDVSSVGNALAALDQAGLSPAISSILQTMTAQEQRLLKQRIQRKQDSMSSSRILFGTGALVALFMMIVAARKMSADFSHRTEAENQLAAKDAQYKQVVELAGDIIYRTDEQGRFTFCNQASLAMLHYTEVEVLGRSYLKLIRHDKRREAERFYLRQFLRKQKTTYFEFPIIDGHGRERWIGQNAQLVLEGGKAWGFQAIARDITERKRAELELQKSRNFVERIAATTPGVLYVFDIASMRTVFSNKEVIAVLGYKPEEMLSFERLTTQVVHPDDQPMITAHYESMRQAGDGEIRRLEYRARHADGRWIWLSGRETAFERGPDGTVAQVVGILQDITARKAAQEKLAYQANYDALTGLPNRHHFWTRLQGALRRSSIEHSVVSLCLFDVDHFKAINDRFGHAAGDEVLEEVGNIVRAELRIADTAGRLGGDEFCFVLPGTDHDEAARVADRVRERLSTLAFGMASGSPFSVTATFGVAESHPDIDAKELMEAADRALYRAKSAGRNRVCVDV
ncbi:MAG TPA: diguanylate cyclase [Bryobacteraceae bacterium]|nr:diguanylate cyclase [Bryobacteraceae bacterium]